VNSKLRLLSDLTHQERSSVARIKQKLNTSPATILRATDYNDNETQELELAVDRSLSQDEGVALLDAHILEATGTSNRNVGLQFLSNLGKAIIPRKANTKEMARQLNTFAQSVQALKPQNE
jgi:hypothetical protein